MQAARGKVRGHCLQRARSGTGWHPGTYIPTLPLGAQDQPQVPRHWAWPAAHHPMAALPPPTCLYKHLGTLPTVTQRRLCPFPGVRLPRLRGLFLTTPIYLPLSQHPDLCPPSMKPALPSKAGEHTRPLWCRCTDTVPCHPPPNELQEGPRGVQAASQRSGPVLGEDELCTHLARQWQS